VAGADVRAVVQRERLGTGHAVRQAREECGTGPILVLPGDMPLLTVETIERLVDRLETRLQEGNEREVPSTLVGEWVMNELHELDEVAYVPWGEYVLPTAFRKNVTGILKFIAPLFWNVTIA